MINKRSLFLPHSSSIMSMNMGPVYPALVREMYPNDRIVISHEALLRAAPMLFPLYSPVKMTFDYFSLKIVLFGMRLKIKIGQLSLLVLLMVKLLKTLLYFLKCLLLKFQMVVCSWFSR